MKQYLADEHATLEFGGNIADQLPEKFILNLCGELGAGKTTLVRGILRKFGFKEAVKSPTYTLVEPYCVNAKCIYHFDLYRLEHPEALEFIGMRDYLDKGVCLIEWAERGAGYLPPSDVDVYFEIKGIGRTVMLSSRTSKGALFLEKLASLRGHSREGGNPENFVI